MNSAQKPIPIIVVGAERSGTKWLSNILCNHPQVIGAQSELHQGIIETNMFGAMQQKFDLRFEDDYIGLIELWSLTDFFRAACVGKKYFYSLTPRPTSCFELFRILMDEYARRNNKSFWLQKCNAHYGLSLVDAYSDARFVIIIRDYVETITSNVQNARNQKIELSLFDATYSHVCHEKALKRVMKRTGATIVHYEGLNRDPETTIRQICGVLGIRYDDAMLHVQYQKNSSFRTDAERNCTLWKHERLLIGFYYVLLKLVPFLVFKSIAQLKTQLSPRNAEPLVLGTFRAMATESSKQRPWADNTTLGKY